MTNKPKMILFDYGQTLVDEGKFDGVKGTEAVLQYATTNKYNLSAARVQEEADRINQETGRFDMARRHLIPVEIPNHMFTAYLYESLGISLPLTAEQIDKVFWDAAAPGTPTDGIEDLLTYLHESGIRTGVISNIAYTGKVVIDRINEVLPNNYFEFIIATSEYMYRKPNKRIFDLALEKADLKADEVWYVGDHYECDIEGARNAGMFPVWYQGAARMPNEDNKDKEDVVIVKSWQEFRNEIVQPTLL